MGMLRRTVSACLLWENNFYESGASAAERIKALVPLCSRKEVANLAIYARKELYLRHAPLLLVRELARVSDGTSLVRDTLAQVVSRADELAEFLALYWAEGKTPLSKQVQRGLARAFPKFDAYQLAKYNRDTNVKLRDVLFLCHAEPKDEAQANIWKKLVDGTLEPPETWEVLLSGGKDKGQTFTKLLSENKLGYLALLRNLRSMEQAGVSRGIIREKLLSGAEKSRVLPFRFLAAAKAAPGLESTLDEAMLRAASSLKKLPGRTIALIDVSGSMSWKLSSKSDLNRRAAASALAVLLREVCKEVEVFTFSSKLVEVPARRGMALIDAINTSQPHSSTYLGMAVKEVNKRDYDRLVVFTDEQSADTVPNPKGLGYMINVASYQNGVGYGPWVHIDGFSEAILSFIQESERGLT